MRIACLLIHYLLVPADSSNGKQPGQVLEEIADLLEQFSPTVEVEDHGPAYFHVSGVGNEAQLAREISEAVFCQTQLRVSLGIASNKFVARAAAIAAKPEAPVIVPAGEERRFMAPLSIDLLPCPAQTRERLHFLGLHAMGQLARISGESLRAQFGHEGRLFYELPRGIDRRPLNPRQKPEVMTAAAGFDTPAYAMAEIIPAIEKAVDRVTADLKREWRLCSTVTMKLMFSDGSTREAAFHLKQATNSRRTLMSRMKSRLSRADLSGEMERIEMTFELVGDKGSQATLWKNKKGADADVHGMAQILPPQCGSQPLKRVAHLDPDALLPENRYRLIDVR